MILNNKIEIAFNSRQAPERLSSHPSTLLDEEPDIKQIVGKRWAELSKNDIERMADAIHFFSSEAFCYYLPGALLYGIQSNSRDYMVFENILNSLDRSPTPEYWNDKFIEHWGQLSTDELSAVQDWLHWYFSEVYDAWANTHQRCHETLEQLKQRKS